jgi:predicted P-loop ATPase
MLKDIKGLHALGFSIIWLKPKSKAPIENNWTTQKKKSLEDLKSSYKAGYNVGVRLGAPSKVETKEGARYLAAFDCDIKTTDTRAQKEFEAAIDQLELYESPIVKSGRGNGSRHIYFLTTTPQKSFTLKKSKQIVKVKMPSQKPSRKELKELSAEEIEAGIRLRPAWEISVMGTGRQCVLPPSVHPDSGLKYAWSDEPTLKNLMVRDLQSTQSENQKLELENDFQIEEVDLYLSDLPDETVEMIVSGEGVEDRSASIFGVAIEMVRSGFTTNQILSVLTDPENYLGSVGYDHAQTKSRKKAAEWVYKYTIGKAKKEAFFDGAFDDMSEEKRLSEDEATEQALSLEVEEKEKTWEDFLETTGKGKHKKILPSMLNLELIFKNATLNLPAIGMDTFQQMIFWLAPTPWGSEAGKYLTDSCALRFKIWCAQNYKVEFQTKKIEEFFDIEAGRHSYHPVKDYLKTLTWDGVKRLDGWLETYLGARGPKEYLSAVGRKTIVAMVTRIFEPGAKFDNVLILEGLQGIGKSTAARILSEPWFSDSELTLGHSDAVVYLLGNWVIELGELSAMTRYDVNLMKQFISRDTDKVRLPYGRRTIVNPRQCIFIGTTNNQAYLKDITGNRRFWPVSCGAIDTEGLRRDRDQLLAEAIEYYLACEPLYLDQVVAQRQAQEIQEMRTEVDSLTVELTEFFDSEASAGLPDPFTLNDLIALLPSSGLKNDRSTQMRVASCLTVLGYGKVQRQIKGLKGYYWAKELKALQREEDAIIEKLGEVLLSGEVGEEFTIEELFEKAKVKKDKITKGLEMSVGEFLKAQGFTKRQKRGNKKKGIFWS